MTAPRQQGFTLPVQLPAVLRIDDDEYALPAWSTRRMLTTLAGAEPHCWWNLIPAHLDRVDCERLVLRLFDDDDVLDIDELEERATDAIGRVCGMWFWAAHRMAATLVQHWLRFDGWSARHGFAPLEQPIGRVLAAGYEWVLSRCEKESQVAQIDQDLWGPPPVLLPSGRERDAAPDGWDDGREESAFFATMNQLSGLKGR